MGRGVGGRSPRRGGRSGRSERANALPEGGAAAKRERAPLPSLFLRATPAPPPRRPSPLRARPPQPRAPEARAVGGLRPLHGPAAPPGPLLRPRRGASARKGPQKYAPGRAANGPRGRGQIESDPRETNGGFGAFRARLLRIFSPAPPAPRCAARGRLTATENRTAARARAKTRGRPNRARRSNRIRERNLFAEYKLLYLNHE